MADDKKESLATGGERNSRNTLYCSFCGKSQYEVQKLIAGPTVFICDECVELCVDHIEEDRRTRLVPAGALPDLVDQALAVCENFVPGNQALKREIALEAAGNLMAVRQGGSGTRARALFLGPPGCGIAEILKSAWEWVDSPVILVDGSQLRETRLVGSSALFPRILEACDYNLELVNRSVVIINNIDRIADSGEGSRQRQEELEVALRGTLVPVIRPDRREPLMMDTSSISFFGISSILHQGKPALVPEGAAEERVLSDDPARRINQLEARGFIRDLVLAFDSIREYGPIHRGQFEAFLRSGTSVPLAEWRRSLGSDNVALEEGCMTELMHQVERRGSGLRALQGLLRTVGMRIAFERHSSSEGMLAITPQWLRENL